MSREGKIGMVSFRVDSEGELEYLDGNVKNVTLEIPEKGRSISKMQKDNSEKAIER